MAYQDPSIEEPINPNIQEHDPDEAEETLSFCDLAIQSSAVADEWENLSKLDQSSSSSASASSDDQDLFEFFSEDWSTSSTHPLHHQNIVFCGKIIPFREPDCKREGINRQEKPKKRGLFIRWKSWKSNLFGSKESGKKRQTKPNRSYARRSKSSPLPASRMCGCKAAQGGERYGFSVRRVSILASPAKSRWHLLMFGLVRLPAAEMELGDIRSRQNRRPSPAALFGSGSGNEKVKLGGGKGLWRMIRGVGSGGSHQPNAVNGGVGCFPSA